MQVSDAELTNVLGAISTGAVPADLETQTLDFKSQPDSKPDAIKALVEAAVCFANSSGGTVVMGVADKTAGLDALLGCDLDPKIVQRRINELTEPPLMVGARLREYMGATLLVVDVFQSFDIHADKQGRASHRVGTECKPLSTAEHRRLREERLPVDWSGQPSDRLLEDVDPGAMLMARESLRRVPDEREQLATLSDIDLLRALGVVDENDQLLRAGEVLFCNPKSSGRGLVYEYRLTPGGEASAVERVELPMMVGFERTMELIWARRNVTPVTLPNGQQIDIADFPEIAVREALSNALVHRDYRLAQPVNIEHSPSAFIAWSPGPLVGSVTSANILTHASTPRNPVLAAAARVLRLAEQTGRGVDRMYREMIRAGQDFPIIEEGLDYVRVVLGGGGPRTSISKFVAQLPSEEREDTDLMLVLYALCQRRTVTAESLAPLLQKSDGETELVLRRLSQEALGIIERTRES